MYADVEFADLADSCQRLARLGTGSGSCPDAVIEGAPVGRLVFEGDTTGKGDDVTLSCQRDFDNAESPDLVVEWRAPAAGIYTFSTEDSAFVTQLGLLDGCGGAELGCSSPGGTSFGAAVFALSLAAEQSVLIVLDGYHVAQSGYVRLNVTYEP